MTTLYNEIKDYLISLGFSIEGENGAYFRMKKLIPGRTLIVNGQRMEEPDHWGYFDIVPLGQGAELDEDNNPVKELQGYNIGDNDFWVDSLKDFQFWLEKVVGRNVHPVIKK